MLVLGLDGLPMDLAASIAHKGILPNLADIIAHAETVRSELPELSPVNWTSFFTATGPEEHGVFGFTLIDPRTYAVSLTDFTRVKTPTIFERLGEAGLVSRVINLPGTYPARPIRGMLISGFTALDLTRAVYPPFLARPLSQAGYRLEADTTRGQADPDFLLAELRATLASRETAMNLMWPDLAWNLFVIVHTETDRLFHFLFDALTSRTHPLHGACLEFMRDWDRQIGRILDRYRDLPGPKRLMVLADHGFTRLKTEVDINAWLKKQGLLITGPPANELDASCITGHSKALAMDPGRVYIHTRKRFARGAVEQADARELRARIKHGLANLTWNGEPVMQKVHEAEKLYPGPHLARAPDLVCEPKPGFGLTAKFDREEIFGLYGRTGCHTPDGAIFYDDSGARSRCLRDTGSEVLKFFGIRGFAP